MQQQRAEMAASRSAVTDWIEYLSCSPLPDPRDVPAMTGYLATVVQEADTTDLHKTLQLCEVSCGEQPPTGLHKISRQRSNVQALRWRVALGGCLCTALQACLQLAEHCHRLSAEEEMEACLQEALTAFAGPGSTADNSSSSTAEHDAVPTEPDSCPTSSSGSGDHQDAGPDTHAAADGSTDEKQGDGAADQAATEPLPPPATAVKHVSWDAAASAAACKACRARAAQHQHNVSSLYDSIRSMVDAATAHVLHVSG